MERNTLYRWIAQQLIERISSGNLKPGDRLPGEYQLAKDFHVGRSTIRDALRLLQESEHIEVRNGVGSFVAAPRRAIANPLTLLTSIGTMIEASGFKASAHIEWVRHQQPEAVPESGGSGCGNGAETLRRQTLCIFCSEYFFRKPGGEENGPGI